MDKEELYRKYPQLYKPGEGGRPKGVKNKSPKLIREAITKVIEGKADKLDMWLDEIADEGVHGKARAIELIIKLAEYVLPKLSKNQISGEITHTPIIIGKPKGLELPEPSTDLIEDIVPEKDSNTNNLTEDQHE